MIRNILKFILAALILSLVLLGVVACEPERPASVLSNEKMEDILTDYYLIDAAAQMKNIPRGDTAKYALYNEILAKHNVTLAEFDSTVFWYSEHTEQFEKVMEEVVHRIETRKD
ncbi:MAG: DUF4296 domain-containing protein [Paludibacteraceae bacterium]|nr:DUF4296 domain-containing protein [Paludibacteraceae bacterium]